MTTVKYISCEKNQSLHKFKLVNVLEKDRLELADKKKKTTSKTLNIPWNTIKLILLEMLKNTDLPKQQGRPPNVTD